MTLVALLSCCAAISDAQAQPGAFTGMLTPHAGVASGGDVRGSGLTPGISMAVVDHSGLGMEVDLGHTRGFDDSGRLAESGITSVMLNFTALYAHDAFRPFVSAGAGALRVRASPAGGATPVSRTDFGVNAGGGLVLMFNEAFGIRGDLRYFRYLQRHSELPLLDNGFFDYWRSSFGVTFTWPIR